MKLNRKLVLVLALVLSVAMATSGTLAYLTDRDSEANVFTVGNVEIELNEEFNQGSELTPGVKIEKMPTITNTGKNDAWVWYTFSIPAALDSATELGVDNIIHYNYFGGTADQWYEQEKYYNSFANDAKIVNAGIEVPAHQTIIDEKMFWTVDYDAKKDVDINGVKYNQYTYLYNKALTAGETTLPSIHQVYLDQHVDINTDGQMYYVNKGVATKVEWNVEKNGYPVIYVSACAMQKEEFNTVEDAYKAYNTQWTTDAGVNNGIEYEQVTVSAPESGAVRPAGVAVPVEGGTYSGLNIVDGSDDATNLRALYTKDGNVNGNVTVLDSVLDGTYAMNVTANESANAVLTVEDTTLMGWSSYSGFKMATFENCTFKLNSEATYNYVRAYDDTIFTNCEFKGTKLDIQDGSNATVTLVNCTYNGEPITEGNLSTLLDDASEAKYVSFNLNKVSTANELTKAVEEGGTIVLESDITLTKAAGLEFKKDAVLLLNGNDITGKAGHVLHVMNGATLIVNGEGTLTSTDANAAVIVWADGGHVVLNGGTYKGVKDLNGVGNDTVYTKNSGTATINGGKYFADSNNVNYAKQQWTCLNKNDTNGGDIVVTGGTFYRFHPGWNYSEGEGTNFVAEGYEVTWKDADVGIGTMYTVVKAK